MKKILIVDDIKTNLDVAKLFFSKIPGFEFLFAVNRKEAEELLKISDALITDGSFPYENEEDFDGAQGLNGYYLLLLASSQTKPAILLSDHGEQFYSRIARSKESSQDIIDQYPNFNPFNPTQQEQFWNIARNSEIIFQLPTKYDATKKDSSGWKYGWEEIQKQF